VLGCPGYGRLGWGNDIATDTAPHHHRRRLSQHVRYRQAPPLQAAVPPARSALTEPTLDNRHPLVDADGFHEVLPRAARL